MKAKILLSPDDIDNIHECCLGTLFTIKGVKEREFLANDYGYVFEFVKGRAPHKRLILTCYYASSPLNFILGNH